MAVSNPELSSEAGVDRQEPFVAQIPSQPDIGRVAAVDGVDSLVTPPDQRLSSLDRSTIVSGVKNMLTEGSADSVDPRLQNIDANRLTSVIRSSLGPDGSKAAKNDVSPETRAAYDAVKYRRPDGKVDFGAGNVSKEDHEEYNNASMERRARQLASDLSYQTSLKAEKAVNSSTVVDPIVFSGGVIEEPGTKVGTDTQGIDRQAYEAKMAEAKAARTQAASEQIQSDWASRINASREADTREAMPAAVSESRVEGVPATEIAPVAEVPLVVDKNAGEMVAAVPEKGAETVDKSELQAKYDALLKNYDALKDKVTSLEDKIQRLIDLKAENKPAGEKAAEQSVEMAADERDEQPQEMDELDVDTLDDLEVEDEPGITEIPNLEGKKITFQRLDGGATGVFSATEIVSVSATGYETKGKILANERIQFRSKDNKRVKTKDVTRIDKVIDNVYKVKTEGATYLLTIQQENSQVTRSNGFAERSASAQSPEQNAAATAREVVDAKVSPEKRSAWYTPLTEGLKNLYKGAKEAKDNLIFDTFVRGKADKLLAKYPGQAKELAQASEHLDDCNRVLNYRREKAKPLNVLLKYFAYSSSEVAASQMETIQKQASKEAAKAGRVEERSRENLARYAEQFAKRGEDDQAEKIRQAINGGTEVAPESAGADASVAAAPEAEPVVASAPIVPEAPPSAQDLSALFGSRSAEPLIPEYPSADDPVPASAESANAAA